MSYGHPTAKLISINRIFLNLNNPRFEAVSDESQAIAHLCKEESVYALASDIVAQGSLNPLEKVALIPLESVDGRETYVAAEGNRRICALKLLTDPDLAPAQFRKKFEGLSARWEPIEGVSAVIFFE